MPKININNVIYNYDIYGHGESTVVFISGYTCDIHLWEPVAKILSKTNQVLVFDNQGIGDTQDDGEALSIETMAKNIYALINKLEIKNPILVGYAMGATLALQIAKEVPNAITKLILLSSVLSWSNCAINYVDKLIELRKKGNHDAYFELLYKTAFGSLYKKNVSVDAFKAMMMTLPETQTIEDQERQAQALKSFNGRKWIENITTPIVILSPKEDQFATSEEANEFKRYAHNVQIEFIDCGHAAITEEPDTVVALCVKHILKTD